MSKAGWAGWGGQEGVGGSEQEALVHLGVEGVGLGEGAGVAVGGVERVALEQARAGVDDACHPRGAGPRGTVGRRWVKHRLGVVQLHLG